MGFDSEPFIALWGCVFFRSPHGGAMERVTRTLGPLPKQGLHARPAARLVETAKRFAASVTLTHAGTRASAKDLMDLLYLAAPGGTRLEMVAEGEDAVAAADAVEALLASLSNDS